MTQTPPGWYPDSEQPGGQRYWDGSQWTEHRAPAAAAAPPAPAPVAMTAPKKKHTVRNVVLGLVAVIVVIIIATSIGGGGGSSSTSTSSDDSATDAGATTSSAAPKKPSYTAAQANAIRSAKQYLQLGTGFSRAGMIQQLTAPTGNQYKRADAVFAVNHINANWRQQAVVAAKNYLKLSGFSRAALIQQLTAKTGSQFTQAQAEYAADQVGL